MKNIFKPLLIGSILTTGIFAHKAYENVRQLNEVRLEICKKESLNEENLRWRRDIEAYLESHKESIREERI